MGNKIFLLINYNQININRSTRKSEYLNFLILLFLFDNQTGTVDQVNYELTDRKVVG